VHQGRARGQRLPTLPRNFLSTSALVIGRPGKPGTSSTSLDMRRPSERIAVTRVGTIAPTRAVSAGSSFTVILRIKARMRGSWSFAAV